MISFGVEPRCCRRAFLTLIRGFERSLHLPAGEKIGREITRLARCARENRLRINGWRRASEDTRAVSAGSSQHDLDWVKDIETAMELLESYFSGVSWMN